ncbi:formate dehydrogenase accessory sulfurtransferase FdhD [Palleronia sp. KMU-117]|uniref:formate dehydrogenase accessory sulfurtransferase FdhD n=1 Tax=Palleronia sp. KMU-117 TaxID=3434108 RepID=UPI003D73B6EB
MTRPASISRPGRTLTPEGSAQIHRTLPEEVPVAFVFDGGTLAVMMATPADIEDLAVGFALSEGIVTTPNEIEALEVVTHDKGLEARMWLRGDRRTALAERRRFMAGPVGCGLCGIDSLDAAARALPRVADTGLRLTRAEVGGATDALRGHQPLHDLTRAVHAAGFLRPREGIVLAREDVGRHNALDKLIGALARAGVDPASGAVVMTSRVSVELVQKCAVAGVPVLIAVSAPTAHGLRLAEDAGITLAACARGGAFDLYSHPHRIADEVTDVA